MIDMFQTRTRWIAAALCLLTASSVYAAELTAEPRSDAKHNEDGKSLILARAQLAPGDSTRRAAPDSCETGARRSYDRCMTGAGADRLRCLGEFDDAYLACSVSSGNKGGGKVEATESDRSEGVYRIPYADGTKVHISRDFYDHNPPGKIDMSGRGGGTYRIVAAAAGHIRFIEDSRSKQQHPERWLRNTDDCFNNFVWIEHDNGEWSKYSHMQQGTTTGKAGLKVGDYVSEGMYLGDEGKVGCAWPAHLHFEVVVPPKPVERQTDDPSGALKSVSRDNARNPVIVGIEGGIFKDGQNYFAAAGPECRKDTDCGPESYCNAGIDLSQNRCLRLKNDHDTCDLVGGGHQCRSGHCKLSRCYTPDSVDMGGTCYVDDACKDGKCSSIDGARGTCVCKQDTDCAASEWCNAGADLKLNRCEALKGDNEACDLVGGGHQCKGGHCKFSRCYTPGSVTMGGTCYVDDACKEGKCSDIDGLKGVCVCKSDSDCAAGNWCDAGLDLKINQCRAKLSEGESCGKAGSVGNDHKCKSGKCSGFPKYVCK